MSASAPAGAMVPLVTTEAVTKHFSERRTGLLGGRSVVRAVESVDLEVMPGESIAIVSGAALASCSLSLAARGVTLLIFDSFGLYR